MDLLNNITLQKGPQYNLPTKRKIRNRNASNYAYQGLSADDNLLKELTIAIRMYPVQTEYENLAASIVGMSGIRNMNINYLAAALYLYKSNYSILHKDNDFDIANITPKMFSDDNIPMKKIKERLNDVYKSNNEKGDYWIRRKQNVLIYLIGILNFYSENHNLYEKTLIYENNMKHDEIEKKDEDNYLIEELAEGGGYDDANSSAPIWDPDD